MATGDADNSAQINSAHTLQHREQLFSTRQYANDIVQAYLLYRFCRTRYMRIYIA
jgi:hypothetical protein